MSKTKINIKKTNIKKTVMQKIESDQIKMKPKWLFVLGSLFSLLGLVAFSLTGIFFTNLTIFLIKKQGPGYGRLQILMTSFSWWIPVVAILGIALGVILLKKYDFSYKKNFGLIVVGFIASIIIAGFIIDKLGVNTVASNKGPIRGFYQQLNKQGPMPSGPGKRQVGGPR